MIFEAIAAVKVANEAIGAVKELIGHVDSIGQVGSHLTKLTDAKDEIKKKADEGDLEAFNQLQEIIRHEKQIKQIMIYEGRPGLWEDWCRFQQTRRELREKERKRIAAAKARKKRLIKEWTLGICVTIAALSAVGLLIWIFYVVATAKGRI